MGFLEIIGTLILAFIFTVLFVMFLVVYWVFDTIVLASEIILWGIRKFLGNKK